MSTIIVGSISSGTMREEDLVPVFLDTLEELDRDRAEAIRTNYADALAHLESGLEPGGQEDLAWLMHDLDDALNRAAPDGYVFGAHDSDGSLYGFWDIRNRKHPTG